VQPSCEPQFADNRLPIRVDTNPMVYCSCAKPGPQLSPPTKSAAGLIRPIPGAIAGDRNDDICRLSRYRPNLVKAMLTLSTREAMFIKEPQRTLIDTCTPNYLGLDGVIAVANPLGKRH